MVQTVKSAIASKLKELYPTYNIYDEDVPQKFKTPSFMLSLINQDYTKRLDVKYSGLLSFDLAYFSDENVAETKGDCIAKQQAILRAFDLVGTFRVLNKQANITDNVLHITFDVRYSEVKDIEEIKMQKQETNTNL